MRACEADRCDQGATVGGRWCPRHVPGPTADNYAKALEATEPLVDLADALEYALEAPSAPDPVVEEILADKRELLSDRWLYACEAVEEAERLLKDARDMRVLVLDNMPRTGMSLADIAEVTGLTRQRIGQLLR